MILLSNMTRHGLTSIIDALHLKRGVVVGTNKGHWSHYLLTHSTLDLLVDISKPSRGYAREEITESRLVLQGFNERSQIIHCRPHIAARRATKEFDFIYETGCHAELVKAWMPKLSQHGGVLSGLMLKYRNKRWHNVNDMVAYLEKVIGSQAYITSEYAPSWFFIIGENGISDECCKAFRDYTE